MKLNVRSYFENHQSINFNICDVRMTLNKAQSFEKYIIVTYDKFLNMITNFLFN